MRRAVRWGMVKKLVVLVDYFSTACFLNSSGVNAVCFFKKLPKIGGVRKI